MKPIYEKQTLKVLRCLENDGEITVLDAVTQLGIMSLPRRIMELRNAGYNIKTEFRKSENGARYGVYKLQEAE
jgi:hypothetical protein